MNLTHNNTLAEFEALTNLGIKNFLTFSNKTWGNMRLSAPGVFDKYEEVFTKLDISTTEFLYIVAEQNNNINFIDEDNLKIYRLFNKDSVNHKKLSPIILNTDGVITKCHIPIIIAPADCSVIVLTGIDRRDSKRFVILLHAGVFGTMLNIHINSLNLAHTIYDFENKDLTSFLYPSISAKHYIKSKQDEVRGHLLLEKGWKDYTTDLGKEFAIDIEDKLVSDLQEAGIQNITVSGLNSFEENDKGNLYSVTYAKNKESDQSMRHAVGVSLV